MLNMKKEGFGYKVAILAAKVQILSFGFFGLLCGHAYAGELCQRIISGQQRVEGGWTSAWEKPEKVESATLWLSNKGDLTCSQMLRREEFLCDGIRLDGNDIYNKDGERFSVDINVSDVRKEYSCNDSVLPPTMRVSESWTGRISGSDIIVKHSHVYIFNISVKSPQF